MAAANFWGSSAALWMMDNPRKGFLMPDDVDHEPILKIVKPYIKPLISQRFAFADAAKAIELMRNRGAIGKLVVTLD